jgi:hypothetical protein
MLRFVFSAVTLAGVLTAAHPAFAETVRATAPAAEQSASSTSNTTTAIGVGKDITRVGFGWGRGSWCSSNASFDLRSSNNVLEPLRIYDGICDGREVSDR